MASLPINEAIAESLIEEALRAQDDERYGLFTNPFILGLLTAAEIARRTMVEC